MIKFKIIDILIAITVVTLLLTGCSYYNDIQKESSSFISTESIQTEALDSDVEFLGPYTVIRVVDGDTIIINKDGSETKVRLIGVDTPESVAAGNNAYKNCEEGKIASVRNLVRFLTEGEVAKSIPRYENRLSDENKGILKEMQQLYDFISNDKELSKFFSFDSGIEDPLKGTEVQEKLVSYLNTLWEKLIQYREENNNKMSQKVKKALDFKISD